MQPNPYGIKRLPFPINRRTLLEQDDLLDFTEGNPIDTTDCSWFVVQLTNENRLKFTSALLAGMDLIYPDEFVSLMQLWLQPTDFPNQFPPTAIGCTPVDLCDLILDCIETTPALQQIIAQYGVSSTPAQTAPEDPINLATELIDNRVGCDLDTTFGMTGGLVDLLDSISQRVLATFQQAASPGGRIGDLIEAIPLIGELPIDDLFQFSEAMMNDIAGGYDAAYDLTVRNDIACLLFCEAKDDCLLTLEDARDVYKDLFNQAYDTSSAGAFVISMITNIYTGQATVYGLHLFILEIMIFGGRIQFMDIDRLTNTVLSLFNDPDPDHTTLCDECECPEVTEVWDFTSDSHNTVFSIRQTTATVYIPGTGYQGDAPGGAQIWTNRYSEITAINGVSTAVGATPLLRLDSFDAETGNVLGNIGFAPWTGDFVLPEELLLVGYGNSGWTQGTIEEVTITGCLR